MNPINPINQLDSKGFTLLEVLIAVFIFAAVLSIIFTSYTGTFRIITETETYADIYGKARIALEKMQEDLESAYIFGMEKTSGFEEGTAQSAQFVGEDKDINGKGADTIRFLSRAHIVLTEEDIDTGIAEIVYYVKENEDEDTLTLYRSDTPGFAKSLEKNTGGLVLCEGLSSVDFKYYSANTGEFDNWDSTEEEFKNRLPDMVSIKLSFVTSSYPEDPFIFMTSVAIPMARDKYGKAS